MAGAWRHSAPNLGVSRPLRGCDGLSWLCYFRALKLGPASQVAPVDKLSVVFTTLFAISFLGERISAKAALGIVLIAAGAVLTTLK